MKKILMIVLGLMMFVSCGKMNEHKITRFDVGDDVIEKSSGRHCIVAKIYPKQKNDMSVYCRGESDFLFKDSYDFKRMTKKTNFKPAVKIKEVVKEVEVRQDSKIVRKTISKILNNKATICETTMDKKPDICIGNLHFNVSHSGDFSDVSFANSSDIFINTGKEMKDIAEFFNEEQKERIAKIIQEKIQDTLKNQRIANNEEILKHLGE